MTALLLTACVGMITGAFLIFRISPMDFTLGVFRRLTAGPKSIRDEINETTHRKKPGLFRREISEAQTVLQATGKEERFPVLCAASLLLFAVGAGIAIIMNNLLLVPVLAAGMMFLPFWYIKLTAGHYRKAVTAELETALSIITTAYLRSEDLQTAVEENINYLNPPVQGVFRSFLTRIKHIDPDMNAALKELKSAIDNEVWREWCEALSACQYDHSMKSTLNPIVAKLSDMRIINGELENLVFAPRKEFISMAALVVLNIPLLYFLNKDWYPDGDSQLAWVRWRTPTEPCVITISVSVYGGGSAQGTITCNIVDLDGNDPPNPLADDRNDAFRLSSIPEKEQVTSASWGIWSPWWQENWEWVENWQKCWHTDRWTDADGKTHRDRWYHWVDNGWWEDHGWWEFDYNGYSASLTASMRITPDEKSPTATASTLKSGYGVQEKVTAKVTTNQSAAVTAAQNAVTYFPEFGYESYWRLLEADISGRSTTFQFKANPYSTYNRRTHFTPIWYPDGSYTPYTWLLDCWTPAGMLSMNLTDSVTIRGNLWEEWHIAPAKQR